MASLHREAARAFLMTKKRAPRPASGSLKVLLHTERTRMQQLINSAQTRLRDKAQDIVTRSGVHLPAAIQGRLRHLEDAASSAAAPRCVCVGGCCWLRFACRNTIPSFRFHHIKFWPQSSQKRSLDTVQRMAGRSKDKGALLMETAFRGRQVACS
jgi:hypothetical protein